MRLRESLREYVSQINAETAATGMPMSRPMFLQWPLDAGAQGADVEDQFMFGSTWLVAPVTTMGATSRSVYLPALPSNATWVYYFNFSSVGGGGMRVDVPTPIAEFPLFFIRPITPPPPPPPPPAVTTLFSAERGDFVACISDACNNANTPGNEGNYAVVRSEGSAAAAEGNPGAVVINGTAYATVPFTLWYSAAHNDNFVSTNATPPDASYGITFANGYVFAAPGPPGALRLQTFFKQYNATSWDYFTLASADSEAFARANGYADVSARVPVAGFVLPATP